MNLFSSFEKREKACKDGLFEELIFCYNTEKLLHYDENYILPEVKRPEELSTDELIDLLLWFRKHARENVNVDELLGHRERLIQFFNQKNPFMKKKYKVVINCCYGDFDLSKKAVDWLEQNGLHTKYPFENLARHDPLLVRCIEELKEEANGIGSHLVIEEIETNRYYIEDYDGHEAIITEKDLITIPE